MLEAQNGALESLKTSEWPKIPITLIQSKIRIRIRIKMKNWIRIKVIRIRNPEFKKMVHLDIAQFLLKIIVKLQ
jgi:hypothetical protein